MTSWCVEAADSAFDEASSDPRTKRLQSRWSKWTLLRIFPRQSLSCCQQRTHSRAPSPSVSSSHLPLPFSHPPSSTSNGSAKCACSALPSSRQVGTQRRIRRLTWSTAARWSAAKGTLNVPVRSSRAQLTRPGGSSLRYRAHLAAPRIGNKDRQDETFAFDSREALRLLCVGREVQFSLSYTIPAANGPALEFGELYLPGRGNLDVAKEMVSTGWAKVKEARRDEDEAISDRKNELRAVEEEARLAGRGLWATERAPVRSSQPASGTTRD